MRCSNCNEEIKDTAKWCGHCGHKIEEQILPPAPVLPEPTIKQDEPEPIPPVPQKEIAEVVPVLDDKPVPEHRPEPAPDPVPEAPAQKVAVSPPKPVKKKKEPAQPAEAKPAPVKEKPARPKEKKKLPLWVWSIAGLLLIAGIVAALILFRPSNLPEQVTNILPNARVVVDEDFTGDLSSELRSYGSVKFLDGSVEIVGQDYFNAGLILDGPFEKGDAILASFMIEQEYGEEWWVIDLYTENSNEYYASIGFSEWYHPFTDIQQTGYDVEFAGSVTPPKAGVWYYVLFAIRDDDEVLLRVWERDNPAKMSRHTWRLESGLTGREWSAGFFAHVGSMHLDEVKVISFSTK